MANLGRNEKGDAVQGTTLSDVLVNLQLDSDGKLVVGSMATPTLTDILTALEKIDDLQQALKSVDTDELITRITDSSGVEINPAEEDGNLASILTAVELIDDLQGALKSVDTDELITRITDSSGVEINPAKEDGNLATAVTHLSAIQTAIELLDDLQGALKSVDTDELITRITDSSGVEINPAKEDGNLADILSILENGLGFPYATYRSPTDFTAVYASSTTITLTGLPDTISDASQIVYVKQVDPTANTSALWVNGVNCTLEESGGTLTITPDDGSTPFGSDDEYEVGLNFQDKAYDGTIDSMKTSEQSPLSDHYTDAVELVSGVDIGTSDGTYEDKGAEIDMRGYNKLMVFVTLTINNSVGANLKLLAKYESGGTEEFEFESGAHVFTLGDSNALLALEFTTDNVAPFLQVQTMADDVDDGGGTIATVDIHYTKAWV